MVCGRKRRIGRGLYIRWAYNAWLQHGVGNVATRSNGFSIKVGI